MEAVRERLEDLGVNFAHEAFAIATAGDYIVGAIDQLSAANEIIQIVTGDDTVALTDTSEARFVAKYAVQAAARGTPFAIGDAFKFTRRHLADPMNAFFLVDPSGNIPVMKKAGGEMRAVAQGVDMKVEVKSDGSIKKGGKLPLAVELFKKFVAEAGENALDNKGFKQLLVKELAMSPAGASTYAHNARKVYEEQTGEKVVIKLAKQRGVRTTMPYVPKGTPRGRRKKVVEPTVAA